MAAHEPEFRYLPELQTYIRRARYRDTTDFHGRGIRSAERIRWCVADEAEVALLPEPDRSLARACPVYVRVDFSIGTPTHAVLVRPDATGSQADELLEELKSSGFDGWPPVVALSKHVFRVAALPTVPKKGTR